MLHHATPLHATVQGLVARRCADPEARGRTALVRARTPTQTYLRRNAYKPSSEHQSTLAHRQDGTPASSRAGLGSWPRRAPARAAAPPRHAPAAVPPPSAPPRSCDADSAPRRRTARRANAPDCRWRGCAIRGAHMLGQRLAPRVTIALAPLHLHQSLSALEVAQQWACCRCIA